jgi:hypothetical protein
MGRDAGQNAIRHHCQHYIYIAYIRTLDAKTQIAVKQAINAERECLECGVIFPEEVVAAAADRLSTAIALPSSVVTDADMIQRYKLLYFVVVRNRGIFKPVSTIAGVPQCHLASTLGTASCSFDPVHSPCR